MNTYKAMKYHIKQTIKELQLLGKSKKQSKSIIYNKTNYWYLLNTHSLALHNSPHQWAIGLLTKVKDYKTLDRYYDLINKKGEL